MSAVNRVRPDRLAASFTRRRFGSKGCQRSVRPFACSVVIPCCRSLFSITSFPSVTSSILWSGPTPTGEAAPFGCPSFAAPGGDQPPDADGPHRFRYVLFGRDVSSAPGGASGLSHNENGCAAFAGAGASSASATCLFRESIHTPYDRCLRFGPRVAATPARLAPVPLAQLWTDQTCTGKLIPASPIAPRIRLPPWMFDGKPFSRPRVQDFGFGQPIISDFSCLLPCGLISLAASFERTPPDFNHTVSERHERRQVCRHGVIGEETSDHLLKPLPLYQLPRLTRTIAIRPTHKRPARPPCARRALRGGGGALSESGAARPSRRVSRGDA